MGGLLATAEGPRKRTWSEAQQQQEPEDNHDQVIEIPKRKRLRRTSGYIYQTLFVNGEGSDITIAALGKQWKLHKIYLRQAAYFQSMFNGSWKEATDDFISIQVPDNNITQEALDTAFGSLYNDEVIITPATVIPVLAASCLLQVESLSIQCVDAMLETISASTVCGYYAAAQCYGEAVVEASCIQWLERGMCTSWSVQLLKDINPDLMERVIKLPNLFVMQIEVDLYTLLVMWAYLRLNPTWEGPRKDLRQDATDYLHVTAEEFSKTLLEREEGRQFVGAFRAIRLEHVINDSRSVQLLETDNILPRDWLLPLFKDQWRRMLNIYQNIDSGPQAEMTADQFSSTAHRYGRVLERNTRYCWRWTGFLYGLDIIVLFNNITGKLSMRRNTYIHPTHGVVCVQPQHSFVIRVDVASFGAEKTDKSVDGTTGEKDGTTGEKETVPDKPAKEQYFKSSGQQHLTLGLDEEVQVLQVDLSKASYPLHVSAHIALVSEQLSQE